MVLLIILLNKFSVLLVTLGSLVLLQDTIMVFAQYCLFLKIFRFRALEFIQFTVINFLPVGFGVASFYLSYRWKPGHVLCYFLSSAFSLYYVLCLVFYSLHISGV